MEEGKPEQSPSQLTLLPVVWSACAGAETLARTNGIGKWRSGITASSFHEMLRPAMCLVSLK